jgi:CheY-like chemotaxis protein
MDDKKASTLSPDEVHDLKNLLGTIATGSEILQYQQLSSETGAIVKAIASSATLALDMITVALSVENDHAKRSSNNIRRLIGEAIEIASPRIASKRINVRVFVDDICANVRIDRLRFIRAIGNILDNSIKRSAGAQIYVIAVILASDRPDLHECVITISDSGDGFETIANRHAVENVIDVDTSYRIGLAAVRGWVTSIGGELQTGNRTDSRGANVRIRFPVELVADAKKNNSMCDVVVVTDNDKKEAVLSACNDSYPVFGVETKSNLPLLESYFWSYTSRAEHRVLLVDIASAAGARLRELCKDSHPNTGVILVALCAEANEHSPYELVQDGFAASASITNVSRVLTSVIANTLKRARKSAAFGYENVALKLPAALRNKRILIVDDTAGWLSMCASLAAQAGAEVSLASDGDEALQALCRVPDGHYDVILIDFYLPFMSGAEVLTRYISTHLILPHQTIVVASADAIAPSQLAGIDHVVTAVVKKPISVEGLLSIFAQTDQFRPAGNAGTPNLEQVSERQQALVGDRLRVLTLRELPSIALALKESVKTAQLERVLSVTHQVRATLHMCGYTDLGELLESRAIPDSDQALKEWLANVIGQIDLILVHDLLKH